MNLLQHYGVFSNSIRIDNNVFVVTATTKKEYEKALKDLSRLADFCNRSDIDRIEIRYNGDSQLIEVSKLMSIKKFGVGGVRELPGPTAHLLFRDAAESGQSLAIVRMRDHKGLVSTNAQKQSGASDNDWLGRDMSQWWPDDQLNYFLSNLYEHKSLKGFEYWALKMDEHKTPIELSVDVELIYFRGELCRMVRTIDSRVR